VRERDSGPVSHAREFLLGWAFFLGGGIGFICTLRMYARVMKMMGVFGDDFFFPPCDAVMVW